MEVGTGKAARFFALLEQSENGISAETAAYVNTRLASLAGEIRDELGGLGFGDDLIDEALAEWSFEESRLPHGKTVIPMIMDELESGIRALHLEGRGLLPQRRPVMGALRTGQVNAMTIGVPNSSEFVVAIESDLFLFTVLAARAVTRGLPVKDRKFDFEGVLDLDREQVERRLDLDPLAARLFSDTLLGYARHGRFDLSLENAVDRTHGRIAVDLSHGMQKFVVGHEIGHLMKGDLAAESRSRKVELSGHDVESIEFSWEQEFASDRHGLELSLLTALPPGENGLSYRSAVNLLCAVGGGDLFFSMVDVMDRTASMLRTGEEEQLALGSHPPAVRRRAAYRQHLDSLFGELGVSDGYRTLFTDISRSLEFAVDHLWNATRPLVAEAHRTGARPADHWRLRTR